MQTERVTFLTSRDHKKALDTYANREGKSVGNVVREATAQYIAQPLNTSNADEAALDLLVDELEAAIPQWNAKFDSMEASLDHAHKAVREALAKVESLK